MQKNDIKIEKVHKLNLIERVNHVYKYCKIISVVPYELDKITNEWIYIIFYDFDMKDDDIPF